MCTYSAKIQDNELELLPINADLSTFFLDIFFVILVSPAITQNIAHSETAGTSRCLKRFLIEFKIH